MFVFFHGYSPDTWDNMLRTGLVAEGDGIRFQESIDLPEELKFNNLAKKGGELYSIIKERNCPFFIDRLQGGCYIENYPYDKALLEEYRTLLGDKFYGFQMHEWLSNYRSDANKKLAELSSDEWTEENIKKISIYMADQQVSAVVRSKISKRKIAIRNAVASEEEVYSL